MTDTARVTHVLFVCTANECRSPFAAAIAGRLADGLPIRFDSAGVDARRRPVGRAGLEHARESGFDLTGHVSVQVRPDQLAEYDLVLALSREHARELLSLEPTIRPRLFTIKQFARWIDENPRPRRAALGPWLDLVAAERPRTELLGASRDDDVADPVDRPIGDWRRMSAELTVLIDRMLRGIFAPRRPGRREEERADPGRSPTFDG